MNGRFTTLVDEFTKFVGSFKDWAKKREEADEEKITELQKEIATITESIGKIDTAMKIIGATLALTLPVTGVLAVCFPFALPWIIVSLAVFKSFACSVTKLTTGNWLRGRRG